MQVLLIVLGLVLMLFGGGCTLIIAGLELYNPRHFAQDMIDVLPVWLPLGLAPLLGGFFMFRAGLRVDRAKRARTKGAP